MDYTLSWTLISVLLGVYVVAGVISVVVLMLDPLGGPILAEVLGDFLVLGLITACLLYPFVVIWVGLIAFKRTRWP